MNLLPSVASLTLSPIRLAWRALCRFLLLRQAQLSIPVRSGPISGDEGTGVERIEICVDLPLQLTRMSVPQSEAPFWTVTLKVGRATILDGVSGESLSTGTIPPEIDLPVILPGQQATLLVTNLDSVARTFRAEIWGVPLELRAVA